MIVPLNKDLTNFRGGKTGIYTNYSTKAAVVALIPCEVPNMGAQNLPFRITKSPKQTYIRVSGTAFELNTLDRQPGWNKYIP